MDGIARSKGVLGSTKEMLLPAAVVGKGRYSERLLQAVDHALGFAEHERPQSIAGWRRDLISETGVPQRRRASGAATDTSRPSSQSRSEMASPAAVPAPRSVEQTRWSAMRGPIIWGSSGAAAIIAVLVVLPTLLSTPREGGRDAAARVAPTAPTPATDGADTLRKRLGALEQELAEDRKRLSELMAGGEPKKNRQIKKGERMSQPKPAPKNPVAAPPATPAPVPVRPAPAQAEPAATSATELLASADRAYARGSRSEAIATLKALVERDYAKAMVRLGDLYLQGEGVERRDQEALSLFRRAANQGDSDARLRLGDMYAIGQGVPRNTFQAYVWYSAAALAGNAAAKANQERAAALLQPAEIQQAGRLVERMARLPKEK